MKICTKCQELNSDDNIICKNCLSSGDIFKDYTIESNKSLKKINSNFRRLYYLKIIILTIYILLFSIFSIINIRNDLISLLTVIKFILILSVGFILTKFTDFVFSLTHFFTIDDTSKIKISDIYNSYLKLIGFILIIYPLIILIYTFFVN